MYNITSVSNVKYRSCNIGRQNNHRQKCDRLSLFTSRKCLPILPACPLTSFSPPSHLLLTSHPTFSPTIDFLQSTSDTASQSSSSELSYSKFSSIESKSEDPLTQLAKEVKQQPFTTNESLRNSLERRQRALQQDQTRDQYLVFTSVPPAQSSRLSDDRSRTSKYSRFFYNAETGILIAKVRQSNIIILIPPSRFHNI